MQDGTKRSIGVRDVGRYLSSANAVEGALVSEREIFNIGSVSSLTKISVVGWINCLPPSSCIGEQ